MCTGETGRQTKYIFVTGGVVSGLGKGITAASLGRLLKARGLKIAAQKLDPYINVDPGTMSPYQHGEVFVTEDGAETDLDLGHYERFIDENLNQFSNLTTGKVYWNVLTKDIAENLGDKNDETYGTDPVLINTPKNNLWIADNFLNVVFRANYGGSEKHFINVIQPDKENDPYTLEFRHNAYNDPAVTAVEGLVCFRLDELPDTNGETVKLKLHVKTFTGDEVYELDYNTSKQAPSGNSKSISPTGDLNNLM